VDTLKSIFERRSIRNYTGDAVDRDNLLTLAKAGMAAPSSYDTRHFRLILVDDEETISKLAEAMPNAKMVIPAKHAVIVASDLSVAHGGIEIDYWLQDCSAAAQNVLLAAHDLGLGACWTGIHPREERVTFVKELMGIPENVRPVCLIVVGTPSGEEKPRDKFDASFVCWNRWGNGS